MKIEKRLALFAFQNSSKTSNISPKFRIYFPKFPDLFPPFKICGLFETLAPEDQSDSYSSNLFKLFSSN